jgi:uncharacterized membrane protein
VLLPVKGGDNMQRDAGERSRKHLTNEMRRQLGVMATLSSDVDRTVAQIFGFLLVSLGIMVNKDFFGALIHSIVVIKILFLIGCAFLVYSIYNGLSVYIRADIRLALIF